MCIYLGMILYRTEPPGSTVLLEGVRGWQNYALLSAVMVNWQRKEDWHAGNCRRSVRCEVAPKEGGIDRLAIYVGSVQHTPVHMIQCV